MERGMGSSEEALGREIHVLGTWLGDVIRETEGEAALALVEVVRLGAKKLRDPETFPRDFGEAGREVLARLQALDLDQMGLLVRAFTVYFHLVNLAEERHRMRVLHERERTEGLRGESLGATLRSLAASGFSAQQVRGLLDHFRVEPVFTAHPTEARRRTLLQKLGNLRSFLEAWEEHPSERVKSDLMEEITSLWLTEESSGRSPTVLDEVRGGLHFFEESLWQAVPRLMRDLAEGLKAAYPGEAFEVGMPLRFGSWIGGDRDGHPLVTAAVTAHTLRLHRETALQLLERDLEGLHHHLSVGAGAGPFPELTADLAAEAEAHPVLAKVVAERFAQAPFRAKLAFCLARLRAARRLNAQWLREHASEVEGARTGGLWRSAPYVEAPFPGDAALAYPDARPLQRDLELLGRALQPVPKPPRDVVAAHGGYGTGCLGAASRLAQGRLQEVLWRVACFGFHLARLDIRQHSGVHAEALDELLRAANLEPNYLGLEETARETLLLQLLEGERRGLLTAPTGASSGAQAELMDTLREARAAFGPEASDTYIVSMTAGPSDLLAPLLFLKETGQFEPHGASTFQVVPLFETIEDLQRASAILGRLWDLPLYRAHLKAHGNRQMIMLGYSDSNKDGGYVAASWALYQAQVQLTELAAARGVEIELFHGRGGAVGRGGGPMARAIRAQPPGSLQGSLRITEQGEAAHARYDHPDLAHRHLEQTLSALLEASLRETHPPAIPDGWTTAMAKMAGESRRVYREEIYGNPAFLDYLWQATPLTEIRRLRLGSRPASRKNSRAIEDLRAIPWVFAWMQNRHGLPGWFGLGSGCAGQSPALLAEMYEHWPFFGSMVDNAQISLGKADRAVASLYAELAPELTRDVFRRIQLEWERTLGSLLVITGGEALLEATPVLRRSIALRNPYVDPLNFLQVALMPRLRALPEGDPAEPALHRLLALTINGIAAGLQNTG